MKLEECTIGVVVRSNNKSYFDRYRVGHIVGLDLNRSRIIQGDFMAEVIPLVKWAGDEFPIGVHYKNLSLLKDKDLQP